MIKQGLIGLHHSPPSSLPSYFLVVQDGEEYFQEASTLSPPAQPVMCQVSKSPQPNQPQSGSEARLQVTALIRVNLTQTWYFFA